MRVMVLVKATKESESGVLPSGKDLAAMGKFNEEMVKAGVLLTGEGVAASKEGVRISFSGKKATVVDGPFAETKELVAGYWLMQVKTIDEAVEWIKRAPFGHDAEVEIRRILEWTDFGDVATPEVRERVERLRAQTK
jgi:hypothetical protein